MCLNTSWRIGALLAWADLSAVAASENLNILVVLVQPANSLWQSMQLSAAWLVQVRLGFHGTSLVGTGLYAYMQHPQSAPYRRCQWGSGGLKFSVLSPGIL